MSTSYIAGIGPIAEHPEIEVVLNSHGWYRIAASEPQTEIEDESDEN